MAVFQINPQYVTAVQFTKKVPHPLVFWEEGIPGGRLQRIKLPGGVQSIYDGDYIVTWSDGHIDVWREEDFERNFVPEGVGREHRCTACDSIVGDQRMEGDLCRCAQRIQVEYLCGHRLGVAPSTPPPTIIFANYKCKFCDSTQAPSGRAPHARKEKT